MTGFPSASALGWQSSRLPADYVGMAEVSRRARGAQPCPRQKRTFAPNAVMYKHAAWLTARQAIARDYYAANDAKELLITACRPAICSVFHYTFAVGVGTHTVFWRS